MKITIKKSLDVTPSLETYIIQKLESLDKFIVPYEKDGECELWIDVARANNHHHKGDDLFTAVIQIKLPHKTLRSEGSAADIRVAVDDARDMLHMEIEKYKGTHADHQRGGKER